jgi:hypothetical protein
MDGPRWKGRKGPLVIKEDWLKWGDGTVPNIAQSIWDDDDFSSGRLGVLADALEDSGCDEEYILRHLRNQTCKLRCIHCQEEPGYNRRTIHKSERVITKGGIGTQEIAREVFKTEVKKVPCIGGVTGTTDAYLCQGGYSYLPDVTEHVRGCWAVDLLLGLE